MAVANSTTQIIIPGLDALVQTNLNTVLSSNSVIATILANLNAAGSVTTLNTNVATLAATVSALPQKEGTPQFAIWQNRDNTPRWSIFNGDLQKLADASQHTDTELYSPWTGTNYTNGNIGGNGWTSYWWGGTPLYQADSHIGGVASWGQNSYNANNPDAMDERMARWGVIIGNGKKRQKISLYHNNNTLAVSTRGGYGFLEYVDLNSTTYATWASGGNTSGYGMVGYNERTNTLVVIEAKDTANNYRMHVWVNSSVNLNNSNYNIGSLYLFLSGAKTGGSGKTYNYYDFQWQANSSQNYTESRYRMRVIPGDNGVVGLGRLVHGNITHYATFQLSANALTTSYTTLSVNGGYGIDSGNKYGMRHQITFDNNWVAAYSPYYYYGCGMNVYFVDTRDPRNYYIAQNSDTNNGCQLMPIKDNKFIFNYSVQDTNGADGLGMRLYIIDLEGIKTTGRTTSGTLANGGTISLTANVQQGMFDTYYTSTNYNHLMPVSHWRTGA